MIVSIDDEKKLKTSITMIKSSRKVEIEGNLFN